MLVHNHKKIRFHRLLNPIRGALALPLMLYDVLPEDKPDLQERIQGPVGHRYIMQVPPCIPHQDRPETENFRIINLNMVLKGKNVGK